MIEFNKETFKKIVTDNLKEITGKNPKDATIKDIYQALSGAIMVYISDSWADTNEKINSSEAKEVFYFSAEFLMGRALGNNLINFGINEAVIEIFEEMGIDLNEIENQEIDAGLGNGGLGRLAACFLDSLSTLKLPSQGYGIRYKYGMFKQKIENGYQIETPDSWFEQTDPWEIRKASCAVKVKFGGIVENVVEESGRVGFRRHNTEDVLAVPYDMPILGFKNKHVNCLRLWQAESIEPFDLEAFNNGEYDNSVHNQNMAENISRVLYPNDNTANGKELRLKQQYFFCSASLQDIVNKFTYQYGDDAWNIFPDKIAIQLNDTHPVVAIPELMRIFMDWKELDWDVAWNITTKVFSYTNHTILAEALEKWEISMFRKVIPRVYQIIEEINRRFVKELQEKYPDNHPFMDKLPVLLNGKIHMANLAVLGSYKVNGVAELHTNILKNDVFKEWYQIHPEKFLNKTNGITPRRWIVKSNPRLTTLIDKKIGESWKTNLEELTKLLQFENDHEFLNDLLAIKYENKKDLAHYLHHLTKIDIDPTSIFDVQIKRLHEYKRQLLNVLHIIYLYHELKLKPDLDIHPRTFIFGAKAASGYYMAKLIIKLINNVADVVNRDADTNKKIKVIFVPNYQVSIAEHIFPAADVSEQISTAGKEASGTGNMKFMANGAITLGTLDGANIEILEEAGEENCIIFGATADEISKLNQDKSYHSLEFYNSNPKLQKVLNSLIDQTFTIGEDPYLFKNIFDSLVYGIEGNSPDPYYLLKDFDSYIKAQEKIDLLYRDKNKWSKMMLHNIAKCGKFSSDRTIKEYADEIWHIKPME